VPAHHDQERIDMNVLEPRRALRATLVAAAIALGSGVAWAQPTDAPAAAQAHAHPMRAGGDPMMGALIRLHDQLALDSSQQAQWDNAVATMKSAHAQGATLRQNAKATFDAEIAKDQPDLAAVAAAADAARAQGDTLRRSVRDAWLGVYANLNPQQKAMVGSALRQRAADMEQWRQQKRGRAS
jgi:Spy/CpxP family protein refolding chaperone